MKNLMQRYNSIKNNSTKGFTLVELIVVIVIIAILIAALTPAVLGMIDRANVTADMADARRVMIAASVVSMNGIPGTNWNSATYHLFQAPMDAELGLGSVPYRMRFDVYFLGNMAVGVRIVRPSGTTPHRSRSVNSEGMFIGNTAALRYHGNVPTGQNDPNFIYSVRYAPGFERRTFMQVTRP